MSGDLLHVHALYMTTKKMRVHERLHMQPSDEVDEGIKLMISGSLLASINKKLENTLWLHKYNWVTVNIKELSSPGGQIIVGIQLQFALTYRTSTRPGTLVAYFY